MSLSSDIPGHPVAREFLLCFILLLHVCLLTDVNHHSWLVQSPFEDRRQGGSIWLYPRGCQHVSLQTPWWRRKWGLGRRAGAGEAGKSQKTTTGAQRTLFLGEAHWCSEHWLPNSTLFYICAVPSNHYWCLEEHSQTCCRLSFSPETQSLPLLTQVRFSGFNCWILCLKKNLLAVQR